MPSAKAPTSPQRRDDIRREIGAQHCLFLEEQAGVRFAVEEQEGAAPVVRMRITANSGIPFRHAFWGNFAIDLDGISIGKQQKPLLRDHFREVGYTTRIEVVKGEGLVAEAVLLRENEAADEVAAWARQGFPWQASVYIPPSVIERVQAGASVQVNGYTLHGPGTVFRKSVLREVTVTALGADENTAAERLAANRKEPIMAEEMTAAPSAPAPDLSAALAAERKRAARIMAAAQPHQAALAARLVDEGVELGDALFALIDDARKNPAPAPASGKGNTAALEAATDTAPAPVGPNPGQFKADEVPDHPHAMSAPAATPSSALPRARARETAEQFEERCRQHFRDHAESPALSQFDEEGFVGLCQLAQIGCATKQEMELVKGLVG